MTHMAVIVGRATEATIVVQSRLTQELQLLRDVFAAGSVELAVPAGINT
jgi:hypothetical protein